MENKNWKNLSVIQTIKSNMGILAGLVILCVVLSFTTSSFATVTNLFNVVRQITINLFLACGMTFVILLAGIDLSVGSVIAVSGCISAGLISWNGLPVYVGILGGILTGVVIGLINGYIVSSTNIPAFIVTLAMMNIGRGIARVYTKAQTISVLDDSYTFWGMGTIFGIPIQLYCIVAVIAVSSFIGVILGGILSDRWVQKNIRGRVYTGAIGLGMTIPALLLLGFGHSFVSVIGAGLLFGIGFGIFDANNMPILCQFVSAKHRATAYGIMNMTGVFAGAAVTEVLGKWTDGGSLGQGFAMLSIVVAVALVLQIYFLRPKTDNMVD